MVELAQALPTERPVHYCEVGMNGGHSVVSMLLAHPNLTAHVFDPLEYDYSAPVVTLLTNSFQERFVITKGAHAPVTAAPSAAPAAARHSQFSFFYDKICDPSELVTEANKMASIYASKPPLAAQMIKRSVNELTYGNDKPVMHMDYDQTMLSYETPHLPPKLKTNDKKTIINELKQALKNLTLIKKCNISKREQRKQIL